MKVVIIGCGRVGAQLSALLAREGHTVVVVDREARAFARLPAQFRGEQITGIGFDLDTLRRAGIAQADAVVAATDSDNANVVIALIATRKFHVPQVVTRVGDPERAEIYRRFGITTISTTYWAAHEIKALVLHNDLASRLTLGSGDLEVIEVTVPPALAGHALAELAVPGEIAVTALVRQGKGLVPFAGARFQEGDVIYVVVLGSALGKLKRLLGWT